MLMITTIDDARGLTFRLEGELTGAWVKELATIWKATMLSQKPISVDLAAVTYIDAEGYAMLTLMARQGALIVAPNSLNQDLVDEIRSTLGNYS
jgi:ABC-type transporter Mla MlaB component